MRRVIIAVLNMETQKLMEDQGVINDGDFATDLYDIYNIVEDEINDGSLMVNYYDFAEIKDMEYLQWYVEQNYQNLSFNKGRHHYNFYYEDESEMKRILSNIFDAQDEDIEIEGERK